MGSFEFFDHTADLGIRVRAASRAGLVEPATRALYAAIGELIPSGEPRPWRIELTGGDAAELLRDYLNELLVLFERDRVRVTTVEDVRFDEEALFVRGEVRDVDLECSVFAREVKAITYHELAVRPVSDGWEATIIVDI